MPGTPVPRGGAASELPTFDPALALPTQELSEIKALLSRHHSFLGDFSSKQQPPDPFEREAAGVESEDEFGLEAEQPVPASQPIAAAVVAVTKIVADLAGKKKSDKASSLEAALDKAEGFGPTAEGSFSSFFSRSKAAAHRLLKETLVRDPSLIYGAIERLLEEDLLQRRLGTALQDAKASARAWLEFRSNLGPYPTTIRLTWQIAGIWDALREGKVAEARARAALAVAACDQQSLDSGSWIFAEQFCLEPAPPISAFSNRKQHQFDSADSYHSKLFEPHWAELCLRKVRELELHLEAKKKLGGKGRQTPSPSDPPASSGAEKGDKGRKGNKGGFQRSQDK